MINKKNNYKKPIWKENMKYLLIQIKKQMKREVNINGEERIKKIMMIKN